MPYFQQRFNKTAIEVEVWMVNNITLFYLGVITYPYVSKIDNQLE